MKKLIALLLCVLGFAAQATPVVKIHFTFTSSAYTKAVADYGSPGAAAAVQINAINNALTNSGIDGQVALGGVTYNICCGSGVVSVVDVWSKAAVSIAVQQQRELAGADVVMIITDDPDPNPVAYGRASLCPGAQYAVGAVNYQQMVSNWTVVHEFGHLMCAAHDDGYSYSDGTSAQSCLVFSDLMTPATDAPGLTVVKSCANGYTQAFSSPVVDTCSAQEYCTNYAKYLLTLSGYNTGGYNNPTGELVPPGPNYVCNGRITQISTGINFVAGQSNMGAHSTTYGFDCVNNWYARILYYSNPSANYQGVPTGSSTKNAAAKIAPAMAKAVTFRYIKTAEALKEAALGDSK